MSVEVMIPEKIREELAKGCTVHRIVRLASRALESGHVLGTEISITSVQSTTARYNVGRATKEDLHALENFIKSNDLKVVRADRYEVTCESKININAGGNNFLITDCPHREQTGSFGCPLCRDR